MTEIQATIGLVQLKRLPEFYAIRKRNAQRLNRDLQKAKELVLPVEIQNRTPSGYLYTVRIKDTTREKRDRIIKSMHDKGIGADAYYPTPVNQMPYYKENFGTFNLPETEKASKQVLSLPIHPEVTQEQIDYIAEALLILL